MKRTASLLLVLIFSVMSTTQLFSQQNAEFIRISGAGLRESHPELGTERRAPRSARALDRHRDDGRSARAVHRSHAAQPRERAVGPRARSAPR